MRLLRKLAILLGIVCVLAVGVLYLAWRSHVWQAQDELAQVLALTDQADPGWRLEQLEAPETEPSAGAGPTDLDLLLAAVQVSPKLPWPYWSFPEYANDPETSNLARRAMRTSLSNVHRIHRFNPTQIRVLKSELDRAAPALSKLHKILEAPKAHLTSANPNGELLRSGGDFSLLMMLDLEASLNAHDQKMQEAINNLQTILAIARITNETPDLRTQIHWMGTLSHTVIQSIQRVLALGEASEIDLAHLQNELEQAARVPRLLTGLRGDRARVDAILEQVQEDTMSVGQACSELSHCEILLNSGKKGAEFRVHLYLDVVHERAEFLRACIPILELARMDRAARDRLLAQRASATSSPASSGAALVPLDPSVYSGFQKQLFKDDSRFQTTMQAAVAAVAAERYRLKHGFWPQKLADLVPQFLKQVPFELERLPGAKLIQDDGNFKVGIVLLYESRKRRQPPMPWTFTPKPTSAASQQ
ncbi:hypothetical protein BH10PLA2_BH10PLA2_25890 [soil metagenome]